MASENIKMQLFSGKVNTPGCDLEEKVNEFLTRKDIEIHDIKVSNSSGSCVVCIFYKLKDILHAKWLDKFEGEEVCSNCGESALLNYEEYHQGRIVSIETPFCPHCGAQMDS